MKILITGGAGYVGSTLAPLLLAAGHQVRVLDHLSHGGESLLPVWSHPGFEFVRGDIRDRTTVRAAVSGRDAVVHLAAVVGDPACARQPNLARATNLDASLALIGESQDAGVQRFIFASTCSNYGKMKDTKQYVDEESELSPVSLYAETKVAVETALLRSGYSHGWCPTPLRFSTIYGVSPRMRFDLTVNEFTMEMLHKKHLKVFGEQFWRPYVHVWDAARAIQLVLSYPAADVGGRVFNVGATDQNFQKQQLVELIRPYAPDATVEFVHKTEDPRDYRVSFARITNQLGYKTTRTVPQGIGEVARLVRDGVVENFANGKYRN
jgi:nucleoside-diphosphate-sugar epimerase